MIGRAKTYESIIKGQEIPQPGIPESFRVLQKELQSLAIDVRLLDEEGEEIDMKAAAKALELEEQRIPQSIREVVSESIVDTTFGYDED